MSTRGATALGGAASHAADVVVIGSGAGGAAVAGEAARQGLSVIIVEAGPQFSDRPGYNVRNEFPREDQLPRFGAFVNVSLAGHANAPTGPPGLPGAVASYAVGGMMVHWTNHCPAQHPRLERPSYVSAAEWDDLLLRAHSRLHVTPDLYEGSVRQQRILERLRSAYAGLPADRAVQPMPMAGRHVDGRVVFSGADDLLGDGEGRITLLSRVLARRLHGTTDRVDALDAVSIEDGAPVRVEGSVFVVAAGTIGTPQLLAASRLDTRPALGRYLMEHPLVASRVLLTAELREGVPADDPPFAVWLPLSEERPWHVQIVRFHTEYSPVPTGFSARDTADVFCFSSVEPRPENLVRFELDRPDRFGLPQPEIEFSLTVDDRRRLAGGIADQFMVVSQIAEFHDGWAPQLLPMGGSTHLMGSARLGTRDDGASVADARGRVWGYANLFVAGNAVFSETNACNPTVTTVALALRTADAVALTAGAAPSSEQTR